ncbi:hypothetical protein PV08_11823 [Exophiala spinifera]|uniref:Uncharacterized protein n=1 Tax=Exophiala spinifera TaxID=91928 RepID=A0A0D1ZAM5_9EURO|nr:uncharacterized protein PV08_11823 [Exophiala spinifera]KIW10047.1 hypothetical protein PV08_11823 [Exophiala spinifera]
MDSIIFEDPSKPRLRQKPQVRAAPVSSSTSLRRARTPEVEPRVVTPVPGIHQLQEHSHSSNLGHSEPSILRDQTSETPLDELCRSPLQHESPGDGWILEGTSFHDDFSLAHIDDDGLAERLDDDLDSLFSGVLPDLECFTTTESDQHSDARAQTYASQVAGTSDIVNSSPSDDLVCFETPGLRANSDAIDLAADSNCPEPKLTAAPSPQRCSPPSSRHKPGIEVVISTRRPSPVTQQNLSGAQGADDFVERNVARRRTASPRLSGHVQHISGQKRRYMSESDLDSLNSRRVRVEADPKNTPTLVHHMLNEGSTANSREREIHLQEPGCNVRAGIHNPVYGSDSEQTLIDHGASINCDDQTGRDILLRERCPPPTSPLDIDEPFNDHGQEQHQDRLKGLSIQPVTSGDAGFVTAIIDSPAYLQDIFHSPTDWALGRGVQSNDLANIVLKPLAERCWLLTATISRRATKVDNLRRDRARRRGRDSPDLDTSSDFCPSESETLSRPTKRGHWTLDEDNNLTKWRRLGKSWSWIFDQFPERSEAAVRSRWFVVLAPRLGLDSRTRT